MNKYANVDIYDMVMPRNGFLTRSKIFIYFWELFPLENCGSKAGRILVNLQEFTAVIVTLKINFKVNIC